MFLGVDLDRPDAEGLEHPAGPSAVVIWIDAAGHPFSARCRATVDRDVGALVLDLPPELPVRAGPAGLLCHSHDGRL